VGRALRVPGMLSLVGTQLPGFRRSLPVATGVAYTTWVRVADGDSG